MCFLHCSDNFFTRQLTTEESNCLDKCVLKFSNVNQRVMAAYVHDQGIINQRRIKEMEDQMKANEATTVSTPVTTETSSSITIESNGSSTTPAINPSEIQNQSQSQTLVT